MGWEWLAMFVGKRRWSVHMHVARVLWRSNYGLFVLASRFRGDMRKLALITNQSMAIVWRRKHASRRSIW
jgi:hypothetical protein